MIWCERELIGNNERQASSKCLRLTFSTWNTVTYGRESNGGGNNRRHPVTGTAVQHSPRRTGPSSGRANECYRQRRTADHIQSHRYAKRRWQGEGEVRTKVKRTVTAHMLSLVSLTHNIYYTVYRHARLHVGLGDYTTYRQQRWRRYVAEVSDNYSAEIQHSVA